MDKEMKKKYKVIIKRFDNDFKSAKNIVISIVKIEFKQSSIANNLLYSFVTYLW